MRRIHLLGSDRAVFLCDDCGKRLDRKDPGEPFWPDYDRFIDQLERRGMADDDLTLFLCRICFVRRNGRNQPWYEEGWGNG